MLNEEAIETLSAAVQLAKRAGHVRAIISQNPAVLRLLRALINAEGTNRYASQLLTIAIKEAGEVVDTVNPIEPLTRRETEVLRIMDRGVTNRGIATELGISHSTVKRHIANIYGKMQVSNREQAIARGRQAELL